MGNSMVTGRRTRGAGFSALTFAVLMWLSAPLGLQAQVSGLSGFDHTCTDCHLRDHDFGAGAAPGRETRLSAVPFLAIIPGLTGASANCLECHATEEQRATRAFELQAGALPLANGLYLGERFENHHPLGRERRRPIWQADLTRGRLFDLRDRAPSIEDRLRPGSEVVNCSDCHDPHGYDLRLELDDGQRTVCLSCHDPAGYAFGTHMTPACADCHLMHDARGQPLLQEFDADLLCARCHEGTGRVPTEPTRPGLEGPLAHTDLRAGRCIDCHRIHGAPGGG